MISLLVGWIVVWFSGWGGWILLIKKGMHAIKTYKITSMYFFFSSIIVWLLYHNHLHDYFSTLSVKVFPFYFLFIFFLTTIGTYIFGRRVFDKKILESHMENKIFMATLDFRFIVSKSIDIFFQQLLVLCLVILLRDAQIPSYNIIEIVGIVFGIVHLPLLLLKINKIVHYIVVASFLAGFVFSTLIILFPYGFIYSYIVHWSFYVVGGIGINMKVVWRNRLEEI